MPIKLLLRDILSQKKHRNPCLKCIRISEKKDYSVRQLNTLTNMRSNIRKIKMLVARHKKYVTGCGNITRKSREANCKRLAAYDKVYSVQRFIGNTNQPLYTAKYMIR